MAYYSTEELEKIADKFRSDTSGIRAVSYTHLLYDYEKELEYQKAYIENMYGFNEYGMWLVFSLSLIQIYDRMFLDNVVDVVYEIEYGTARRYPGNYTNFIARKKDVYKRQQ